MTKTYEAIFAGLAALSLVAAPAFAQNEPAGTASEKSADVAAAEAFTKALTDKAGAALTDASLSREQQLEKFQAVLAEGLALDVIGKFMLGDKRKSMSAEQIARYDAVFPDYITKLYAEQFDEIVGRPLEVIDSRELNARDIIIRTQFKRASGSPIMVDWRVRKLKDGGQKMVDIIVSGVSIMLVKREEFSAFIAANNIDALLERLEAEAKV
ncbi:MAG: ABC transporter substrate-binding protein [Amphiplicatus sp.]